MDWRRVLIALLAGFAAVSEVNASTSDSSGRFWLLAFATFTAVIAYAATPLFKKVLRLRNFQVIELSFDSSS